MTNNFLTFDIEEWYHANYSYLDLTKYKNKKTDLEESVESILSLCDKYSVKATFFVLGDVAKKYPKIIRQIVKNKHELASHGLDHSLVYNKTPKQFKYDIKKSIDILERLSGKKIVGYRAPSWSVDQKSLIWFYDVLKSEGIKYSSSVFPIKTYLYGIPNFPTKIHYPKINRDNKQVLEIPCSTTSILGRRIGFSGGFYLRLLPYYYVKRQIEARNRSKLETIIYFHPRELNLTQEKLPLNPIDKIVHYWGISSGRSKLENIMHDFSPSFTKTLGQLV